MELCLHDEPKLAEPKAHAWWLRRTVFLISSGGSPEAEKAYRDYAQSQGLREELERTILIYDIEVGSGNTVQAISGLLSPAPISARRDCPEISYLTLSCGASALSR